jgi:hypothetical protein
MSKLAARIGWLETRMGGDARTPRRIIIFSGPDFIKNTVTLKHGMYHFEVPCEFSESAMDHLSLEQRSIIRPGDSVVDIGIAHNGRDAGMNPTVRWRADDGDRSL